MPYRRLKVLKGYVDWGLGPFLRVLASWGVRPIHLTVLSLPLGLGGVFLLFVRPALGAFMVFGYFVLDFLDGTLARVAGLESEFGGRMDFAIDRLVAVSFLVLYYLESGDLLFSGTGLALILAVSLEEAGLIKR